MEIQCDACQSRFNLPDEKLPPGRAVSLKCPKCQNRISISVPVPEAPDEDYDAFEKPFDFVEREAKTALICEADADIRQRLVNAILILGHQISVGESTRDVLKKMRYHDFDMLVVNEGFDSPDPEANSILIHLSRQAMAIRRKMLVVMLTSRYRTMDSMAAFAHSVDVIVNLKNVNEFEKIVSRAIADKDAFYRVFRESLREAGRN
jgi:predicted Zn finger-like uncharacterized protein